VENKIVNKLKTKRKKVFINISGLTVLLLVWAGVSSLLPEYLLPSPLTIFWDLVGFVSGTGWKSPYAGKFWVYSGMSLFRVFTGFSLAVFFGITIGIACGYFRRLSWFMDPVIQLLRSIPGISWLPIAIVWFGIGTTTTVFLIALAAFFPIYINTLQGVKNIPTIWLKAGMMLGANRAQLLWSVILPGAFPSVKSGLRVALGVSWAYVVLGELTGVDKGLGAMIMDARMMGEIAAIIVGMVCIAIWGFIFDFILMNILHRLQKEQS
jgi:NitT/TauT family transport system permease protein